MLRPIQANQDGRLYAIGKQGLRVFVDYLGGLRLCFQKEDGPLLSSMVLSPQETAGLRNLLNQDQQGDPVLSLDEQDPQGHPDS